MTMKEIRAIVRPSRLERLRDALRAIPVSYTHLTLPTICSV